MLGGKLIHCRACHLKWFPKGAPARACPACGGKNVGGTLELFHIGVVLIVLAAIIRFVPSVQSATEGVRALASTASIVETKRLPPEVQRTHAADAQRPHAYDAPRTTIPAAPASAIIKAKKLTLHVQRGPRKGHTVTLRRGERVTILDHRARRYLVRDRRGNQVYVTSDKLNLRQTAEKGRQYVQR